jgi:hypothetical protein
MIGLPDAAPSSRTAGAPTQSRTVVRGCPHCNKAAGCPICQADDHGRVLKLTMSKKQFQVMMMREKNEKFSVLEIVDAQGNVAPKMEIVQGCSLACANSEGGGLLYYDLQSPSKFIATSIVSRSTTKRYSN